MKCKECGEEFTPGTVIQKYCCTACARKYCSKHDMDAEYPSITFTCAECGHTVVTEGGTKDKRTRFCSHECEKKYWKHQTRRDEDSRKHDSGSARQHFHSVGEYLSYEKRDNERWAGL